MALPLGVFLFFGLLAAMDARNRGFSPFLWFVGGSFLVCVGFLVEVTLRSAKDQDTDETERQRRRRVGNVIGCTFGCMTIIFYVLIVCVVNLSGT